MNPYESVFGGGSYLHSDETRDTISRAINVLYSNGYIKNKEIFMKNLYSKFQIFYDSGAATTELMKSFISIMEEDYAALSDDNWDNYIVPYMLSFIVSSASRVFKKDIFYQLACRGLVEDEPQKVCYREEIWGENANQSWKDAYEKFFLDEYFISNPEADPYFLDAMLYVPQTV